MRIVFLFLLLLITNTSIGQSNCQCKSHDFETLKSSSFISDSLEVFNKSSTLKASQYPICVFEALNFEFKYYFNQKENKNAYKTLQEQESLLKSINCDSTSLCNFYLNKANYYRLTNDIEKLTDFSFKALYVSERLKNKRLELESLKAIIYLFMRLDKDAENWEYVHRAKDLIIVLEENANKAEQYIWLAYEFENQYIETERASLIDSSSIFANTARDIAKKHGLNRELAQSYRASEAVAYHRQEPENALKYIDSAIHYGKKVKGVFNLAPFYIAKAWDLVDNGRLIEASKCIDTSLVVDNKKDLGFSANVWHEAKEIYGITGDTAKAYNSFKEYTKLKDSILYLERIKSANDVEAKYKTKLKDSKIEKLTFWLILALAILLTVLLVFYIFQLRKTRENNKSIKQQLELKQELVNVRNTIAKDFHDDLGNKLAKITALSDSMTIKEKSKSELIDAFNKIKLDSDELYRGTKDFMFSLKSESDNFDEIITYLTDFGTEFFIDFDIDFTLQNTIIKPIKLPSYWNRQIILIFKEAMTNIVKHSKCSEVKFNTSYLDNILSIILIDNGVGFDTEMNSKKGLLNMKQRAKSINSGILIISSKEGTIIELKCKLPIEGSTFK